MDSPPTPQEAFEQFVRLERDQSQCDFENMTALAKRIMEYRAEDLQDNHSFPALSPGNISVGARWLAEHEPAAALEAVLRMLEELPGFAMLSASELIRRMGDEAFSVLDFIAINGTQPSNLLAAAHHALESARPSARMHEAVDRIIQKLITSFDPDEAYGASILNIIGMRGCSTVLDQLREFSECSSPACSCQAQFMLTCFERGGDDLAKNAVELFKAGLPRTALESMKWRSEWQALRQLVESHAIPSVILVATKDDALASQETYLGGQPQGPLENSWPEGSDGTPMIYIGRLGADLFRIGGHEEQHSMDLWLNVADRMEDGWLGSLDTVSDGHAAPSTEGIPSDQWGLHCPLEKTKVSIHSVIELPDMDLTGQPDDLASQYDDFFFLSQADNNWVSGIYRCFGTPENGKDENLLLLRLPGEEGSILPHELERPIDIVLPRDKFPIKGPTSLEAWRSYN